MLTYYKYKVDNNLMKLIKVPEPYQSIMREEGYVDLPDPE